MFSSKKLIFIFSALIIASMVLAACAPAAEPVIETVVVTEIVEVEGEEQVVEKIITATPAPEAEEPDSGSG